MDENKKLLVVRQRIFPKEEEVGGGATAAAASLVLCCFSPALCFVPCFCVSLSPSLSLVCCAVLCCTSFPDLSSLFVSSRRMSGFLVADQPLQHLSIVQGRRGPKLSGIEGHPVTNKQHRNPGRFLSTSTSPPTLPPSPALLLRRPSPSSPCVCNVPSSHPAALSLILHPSLLRAPLGVLSDQSSRTPDRKERKANSGAKKRRRSPSPPSTPAEARKKGGKKG